jgi:predicted nucleic acid-binding protein
VRRFLFDTSVFIYALGGEHRYREPCRAILTEMRGGRMAGETSIELVHEFAYMRCRRAVSRSDAAESARDIVGMCPSHAVERSDIERALALWCEHERLDMRDAIFAAQALNREIDAIVSSDRGFDGIDGLERIDPADSDALATLR